MGLVLNINIAMMALHARNLAMLLLLVGMCSAAIPGEPPEKALPDVRLVIDISGSMKQNDPDNLRQPAVELLLQLLPGQSKAGIWTFGSHVNMLVAHKPVTDEWRREAARRGAGIQSVGLYTNIGEALERAAYDINRPDPQRRTSIIMLTDGMVDIDQNTAINEVERQRIIEHVLPNITRAGYRIHTIALSDNADKKLLDELSAATDGIAATAHSADELMRIFLRAFDAAAPSEQVQLRNRRFVIDSSINEFTALIFREVRDEPITLIGPDETIYLADSNDEEIKWYRADNYDLVTVKSPLAGEWQIGGSQNTPDAENRVTIISNLNLRVAPMPHNLAVGDESELVFRLEEKDKTITRTEFLSLLSVNAELEIVEGEARRSVWKKNLPLDSPPVEGVYRIPLPHFDKPGPQVLTLLIDGKSFTRKYTHDFIIRPPLISEPTVEAEGVSAPAEVVKPERPEKENPQEKSLPMSKNTSPAAIPGATPAKPTWVVYSIIAAVNLVVFIGAFFAYRYIMNPGKKSARGENDDRQPRDSDTPQKESEPEMVSEPVAPDEMHKADEDEDEEPPMDDLDSAINELNQLPEFAKNKAALSEEKPETESGEELDDLDLMSIDSKINSDGNNQKDSDEKK